MNINVWDVNETVQRLIRSERIVVPRGARRPGRAARRARRGCRVSLPPGTRGAPHRPPRVRLLPSGRRDGDREPHARLVLRPRPHVRARRRRRRGAERAIGDGADWIDVGGAKFAPGPGDPGRRGDRPGACRSSRALARLGRGRSRSTPSSPTSPARRSPPGRTSINDTTGTPRPRRWPTSSPTATRRSSSRTASPRRARRYPSPQYADVVDEVVDFLRRAGRRSRSTLGVRADRIVVDPGHDLNKNTLHSLELTRRLGEVDRARLPDARRALEQGLRRREPRPRRATSASRGRSRPPCYCVLQGARIVRVHNVRETVDAMRMIEAIEGWREPAYLEHNR